MRSKSVIAVLSALAMIVSPTVAAARGASPAPRSTEVEPASEKVEGEQIRGGFLLPLAVIIAIIIGVLLLTKDDEDPISA
jgi:type IV secretory pathway VirB2 component (pilin)